MMTFEKLECEFCGKIFATKNAKDNLRGHRKRMHSEMKTILCNTCGKTFKTREPKEARQIFSFRPKI